jgi:hypothetical protein
MSALVKKSWRWLLLLLLCYPLGCGVFIATSRVTDSATAKESEALVARIDLGMTPGEVESVMGRPSEYTVQYARSQDGEQFSHNWTVRSHRLEVIFVNGRSVQRHTFRAAPGPVRRFFGWVFFWWLEPFVGD